MPRQAQAGHGAERAAQELVEKRFLRLSFRFRGRRRVPQARDRSENGNGAGLSINCQGVGKSAVTNL